MILISCERKKEEKHKRKNIEKRKHKNDKRKWLTNDLVKKRGMQINRRNEWAQASALVLTMLSSPNSQDIENEGGREGFCHKVHCPNHKEREMRNQ